MSAWLTVIETARGELADLGDPAAATRVTLRLGSAMLLGALIGWDRERRDAGAGLRTHILVALGAALFVVAPAEAGIDREGLSRIVQGIVSGIGFLGAGAVLKLGQEARITGLTTAASIWATAAVGIAAGLGHETTALLATVFVLIVLSLMKRVARRIRRRARRAGRGAGRSPARGQAPSE